MVLTEKQITQLTSQQMNQLLERFVNDINFRNRYPEFCDSKTFMLEAISRYHVSFQWASNRLKVDSDFIYDAVWRNGMILSYVSDELKNNKNFVSIAVKQNGLALQFASKRLRTDKEIVMIAVKQNGLASRFTPLRQDPEIINEALLQIYSKRYFFKVCDIEKINSEVKMLFTDKQLASFFADKDLMKTLKEKTIENGVNKVLNYMKRYPENKKTIKKYRTSVFKFVAKRLSQIEQCKQSEPRRIACQVAR